MSTLLWVVGFEHMSNVCNLHLQWFSLPYEQNSLVWEVENRLIRYAYPLRGLQGNTPTPSFLQTWNSSNSGCRHNKLYCCYKYNDYTRSATSVNLFDWLIDWLVFNAVSEVLQPAKRILTNIATKHCKYTHDYIWKYKYMNLTQQYKQNCLGLIAHL